MKFCTNVHAPVKMNCNNFGDLLASCSATIRSELEFVKYRFMAKYLSVSAALYFVQISKWLQVTC